MIAKYLLVPPFPFFWAPLSQDVEYYESNHYTSTMLAGDSPSLQLRRKTSLVPQATIHVMVYQTRKPANEEEAAALAAQQGVKCDALCQVNNKAKLFIVAK